MGALPKRKISTRRQGKRRSGQRRLSARNLVTCPHCGAKKLPHRICPACGKW